MATQCKQASTSLSKLGKYISKKESSIPTPKGDSSSMVVAILSSDKAKFNMLINSFFVRCFNHALPPLSPESHPNMIQNFYMTYYARRRKFVNIYQPSIPPKLVVLMGYQQKCLRRQQSVLQLPCELPAEWKHALITPIPKSNEMAAVSNYRPISLLPLLSKVLERHVHSLHAYETLVRNRSDIKLPIWFLKGRSTTGALVSAVNDWHTHLDNNLNVCVVFFRS